MIKLTKSILHLIIIGWKGDAMKYRGMRTILLVLTIVGVLGMTGCGSSEKNTSKSLETTGTIVEKSMMEVEVMTETITESVTEKIKELPAQNPTEKVTEPPTEKVMEPVTEKVIEKVTEPPTEKPTEKVTEPPTQKQTQATVSVAQSTPQSSAERDWILNTNTKKFHYPSCSSVGQMKDKNKWAYTGNRESVIDMGYDPCGRCKP